MCLWSFNYTERFCLKEIEIINMTIIVSVIKTQHIGNHLFVRCPFLSFMSKKLCSFHVYGVKGPENLSILFLVHIISFLILFAYRFLMLYYVLYYKKYHRNPDTYSNHDFCWFEAFPASFRKFLLSALFTSPHRWLLSRSSL